jgi:hypothetical protein
MKDERLKSKLAVSNREFNWIVEPPFPLSRAKTALVFPSTGSRVVLIL